CWFRSGFATFAPIFASSFPMLVLGQERPAGGAGGPKPCSPWGHPGGQADGVTAPARIRRAGLARLVRPGPNAPVSVRLATEEGRNVQVVLLRRQVAQGGGRCRRRLGAAAAQATGGR